MSNFLLELSIIHIVLMSGYWFLLRKERQYAKMRFYLISASALAILIPLIKLPKLFLGNETVTKIYPIIVTPMESITVGATTEKFTWHDDVLLWVYVGITAFFLLKFLRNLFFLFQLEKQSQYKKYNDIYIRSVENIEGSFTFFNWIFLSNDIKNGQEDYKVILKHENAHAKLGHSYDLLFFEIFKIFFWWLPTTWFIHKEIKKIHEYQADAYALKSFDIDQYSSILISSTLKSNGLSMASSFHDGLIFKRLKAMKQQVKKVSPWKIGALGTICAILFIVFACSEDNIGTSEIEVADLSNEVFTIVEEQPRFNGGMGKFYSYIMNEIRYPAAAREKGIEGKVDVQFVIEKDGTLANVVAINGIGAGCDQEAMRVIKNAPKFIPGKQRGKAVRARMEIPIVFKLNQEKLDANKVPGGIIIVDEAESKLVKFEVEAGFVNGEWIGTVYDENGYKMPGANIVVAGTNIGTVSGLDGKFKVKANASSELNVSFVGYESIRLKTNK